MSLTDISISDVQIVEVGPRDGLQNEKNIIPTDIKFEYIQKLKQTGLKTIEVTSFVKPSAIAQMSDATELFQKIKSESDFEHFNFPCLVPNLKGYEKAKSIGVQEIALFSATSNSFNLKNINATVDESFERLQDVASEAKKDKVRMRGYISTAFGCPYEGLMDVKSLISVIEKFFDLGVYEVSIGDTIGVGTPKQVQNYLADIVNSISVDKLAMHFHDTRGMAMANILSSLEFGIKVYDSSSGGLGGCPYAKGATGNVATEDLVYLFDSLGIETGIDLDKLVEASCYILDHLGRSTSSKFLNAYLKTKG